MLPNDILGIVTSYNEHDKGFFFISSKFVYWFDGKKCQKWCQSPPPGTDYVNLLYYKNGHLQAVGWIYKKSKWYCINKVHLTSDVSIHSEIYTLINRGFGKFELYDQNKINVRIPNKNQPSCGIYCLVWNSTLYYFSREYCEKYDFISWSPFTNPNCSNFIGQCYILNELFYIIEDITYNINIYDPKKDLWMQGGDLLLQIKSN